MYLQGSLVTQNRRRFDFKLHRGLKDEEVARVEELVNGWVAADTELITKEMPLAEAKAAGELTTSDTNYMTAPLLDVNKLLSNTKTRSIICISWWTWTLCCMPLLCLQAL